MSRSSTILSCFVSFSFVLTSIAAAQHAPSVEQDLMAGKLADADKVLSERLQHNGNDEQAAFELGILVGELSLRDEITADEGDGLARHLGRALQRIEHHRYDTSDIFEIPVTRVEKQECQRDQAEEGQSRQRRQPPVKERGRIDRDVAHRATASAGT